MKVNFFPSTQSHSLVSGLGNTVFFLFPNFEQKVRFINANISLKKSCNFERWDMILVIKGEYIGIRIW